MPKAEGLTLPFESEDSRRVDLLECFPYEGEKQLITYETTEFSAVCPFSGLPDYATLKISYIPNDKIVELKSLKYYITSFRNIGIYQEHVTNLMVKDLHPLLDPQYFKLETSYNTRGGIDATCVIEKGVKKTY